jgi:hypothetical protein
MEIWTYSPDDVQVLIGGVLPVEGLAEGTFVEITKDIMPYTSTRATDGTVGRLRKTNSTYTVNISIMASSPTNDLLTKIWLLDEQLGIGKFPFMVKDSLGTGYFFSATTWIEAIPTLSYGTDMPTRTWGLRSNQGVINIGGNDDASVVSELTTLALNNFPLVKDLVGAFL